jgi:hypothetical protein
MNLGQILFCSLIVALVVPFTFSLSCTIPESIPIGSNLIGSCTLAIDEVTGCCVYLNDGVRDVNIYPKDCDQFRYLDENKITPHGDKISFSEPIDWGWSEGTYNVTVDCWNSTDSESDVNEVVFTQASDMNFLGGWTKFAAENVRFFPILILVGLLIWLFV